MNLTGRQDRVLVAGLAGVIMVVFVRPIGSLLDLVREFEQSSGLALVPGLFGRAEAALYRAKGQGRNCVRLSLETAVP